MINTVCLTCHEKDRTMQYNKLNRILTMCRTLEQKENRYEVDRYRARCRYGLACSDLTNWENKINQLLRKIATYMDSITENDRLYRETLDLLRGEFPITYRQLEVIRHQRR